MTRDEIINSQEFTTMTREQEIRRAASDFAPMNCEETMGANSRVGFINGAKWADEHPQSPQLSAADRGIIDEIIFALSSLSKEKMISYHKEIEFLNKIRKL